MFSRKQLWSEAPDDVITAVDQGYKKTVSRRDITAIFRLRATHFFIPCTPTPIAKTQQLLNTGRF